MSNLVIVDPRSYVLALARRNTGEIAAGTSDGQVFILVHEGGLRNACAMC